MSRETDDWEDYDDDDGPIILGAAPPDEDGPDLGPDEHDMDLLDGSWEAKYYAGRNRTRNWDTIMLALGLLVVIGLIVSMASVLFR